MTPRPPRVIVFGFDGGDPDLLFPWARAGHLPNLRRVMDAGCHARLESTRHPLTPAAWTSMVTGVNPGRHGIFDFGARRPGSYHIDLVTSRDRRFPTIFETLPAPLRSGVVNLPLTFPADPIRGFAASDMHTPSLETPGATHPPELAAKLREWGWIIDAMVHWHDDRSRFLDDVRALHDAQHRVALRLFDEESPDLFFPVYVAFDRVAHAFWAAMTAAHRASPGARGDEGDAVYFAAKMQDDALGDYLARLGPDDHLLVVSDHGFGDLRGDVYLNAWLIDEGYLAFDPAKVRAFVPPPPSGGDDPRHAWHAKLLGDKPQPLPDDDDAIRRGRFDARYKSWDTVDWTRTRAYASGLFGNVWINLRGREPEGIVEPGRDHETLRDELIDRLRELRHPDDGAPLASFVAPRDDLYWGAQLDLAPDIVVTFRDNAYMTRGATEFHETRLVGPVAVGHTGNHRAHGIALLAGPRAARGLAGDSHILDIAPTILYLLGAPIPRNLDRPAPSGALIDPGAMRAHPPEIGPAISSREFAPSDASGVNLDEVRRRLEGLGYLA